MKEGRTLVALATELDRQLETKEDYIVDTRDLGLQMIEPLIRTEEGNNEFGPPEPSLYVKINDVSRL